MKLKLKKIIRFFITGCIIIAFSFYIYLINSWKINLSKKEVDEFVAEIKKAEKLPDRFYQLYNIAYNRPLENGTLISIIESIIYLKYKSPIGLEASKLYTIRNNKQYLRNRLLTEHSLAIKIESESSKKEILNWFMKELYFSCSSIGIKSASECYFKKKLTELTERELAYLVIISKKPSYYNNIRGKELIELKVNSLLKKINSG